MSTCAANKQISVQKFMMQQFLNQEAIQFHGTAHMITP